uniref:Replication factor-A protein 1 N-terminal domain-containing protein n=1 Tax=Setaria viridis TaxID=4556 RepID=A0A4V6D5I4_SETVI|nr:hypothetical protein SEVIR_6G178100v2 [Setaria viridis]
MQVVGVSPMRSELKNFERYYLILSDGVHTQNATLEPHLNHLVKDNHLRGGTIVRLLNSVCYNVQNPRVIVVLKLEVLQTDCVMVGNPKCVHTQDATLATHLNHLVKNTLLHKGTTVRLLEFMCNTSQRPSSQGFKRHLSWGAVPALLWGELAAGQQPVLQVFGISTYKPDYRILLSDVLQKNCELLGTPLSLNMPTSQQAVLRVRQSSGIQGQPPLATGDIQAGT